MFGQELTLTRALAHSSPGIPSLVSTRTGVGIGKYQVLAIFPSFMGILTGAQNYGESGHHNWLYGLPSAGAGDGNRAPTRGGEHFYAHQFPIPAASVPFPIDGSDGIADRRIDRRGALARLASLARLAGYLRARIRRDGRRIRRRIRRRFHRRVGLGRIARRHLGASAGGEQKNGKCRKKREQRFLHDFTLHQDTVCLGLKFSSLS